MNELSRPTIPAAPIESSRRLARVNPTWDTPSRDEVPGGAAHRSPSILSLTPRTMADVRTKARAALSRLSATDAEVAACSLEAVRAFALLKALARPDADQSAEPVEPSRRQGAGALRAA